jgi:hypothetical protein
VQVGRGSCRRAKNINIIVPSLKTFSRLIERVTSSSLEGRL